MRFSIIKKNKTFQKNSMKVGVKKLLRAGMMKQFEMSNKDGVQGTPRFFSFQFGAENKRVFHFSNTSHHDSHCPPDHEHF